MRGRRKLALEAVGKKLVKVLRFRQVLQPVRTEVTHGEIIEQVARRLREQHLASVTRRHQACTTVEVDTDVTLVGSTRLTGVDPHPHVHPRGCKRALRLDCGLHRRPSRRERDQKRVPLRIDLHTAVCGGSLADQVPVIRQRLLLLAPELLQEPSRALNIREQKRDGACRKFSHGRHTFLSRSSRAD